MVEVATKYISTIERYHPWLSSICYPLGSWVGSISHDGISGYANIVYEGVQNFSV
jgi:hypothetical protein